MRQSFNRPKYIQFHSFNCFKVDQTDGFFFHRKVIMDFGNTVSVQCKCCGLIIFQFLPVFLWCYFTRSNSYFTRSNVTIFLTKLWDGIPEKLTYHGFPILVEHAHIVINFNTFCYSRIIVLPKGKASCYGMLKLVSKVDDISCQTDFTPFNAGL